MSKIGAYNLELTEQANELGYATVFEATQHGYEVMDGQLVQPIEIAFEARRAENTRILDEAIELAKEHSKDALAEQLSSLKGEL